MLFCMLQTLKIYNYSLLFSVRTYMFGSERQLLFCGIWGRENICSPDYIWVRRVYSPSEDPVSCFGGVPVYWLYLLYFMMQPMYHRQ
jgi:hypothetical protein